MEAQNAIILFLFISVTTQIIIPCSLALDEKLFASASTNIEEGRKASAAFVAELSGPLRDRPGVSRSNCLASMATARDSMAKAGGLLRAVKGAPSNQLKAKLTEVIDVVNVAITAGYDCQVGLVGVPGDTQEKLQVDLNGAAKRFSDARIDLRNLRDPSGDPDCC